MKKIKTIYFYLFIVLLQAIVFLILVAQVIPSWEIVAIVIVCLLYIIALIFDGFILNRTWRYLIKKQTKTTSAVLTSLLGLLITSWLFYTFMIFILFIGGGPFPGKLEKEINYPKYGKTIYIYNSSFLDPETTIKMREGWLPIMKDKKHLNGWESSRIEIEQKDNIVELKNEWTKAIVRINLETGKVFE